MEKHNYYDGNLEILMANGQYKCIKDLSLEDEVITGDGNIAKVTNILKDHSYNTYEVVANKDGETLCVNKKCLLATTNNIGGKDEISVSKYLKESSNSKAYYRLQTSLPILKFDNAKSLSETNPYVLATLMYNTSYKHGMTISIKEYLKPELAEWLSKCNLTLQHISHNSYCLVSKSGHKGGHKGFALADELGISELNIKDRSIPNSIKYGDLKLRKGFVDATIELCGSPSGPGFRIIKKNCQCIKDIAFMAKSVGYNAYTRSCIKGKQKMYDVYITFNDKNIPNLINKKLRHNFKNPCLLKFKVNKTTNRDVYALSLNEGDTLITKDFIVINVDKFVETIPLALINNSLNISQNYVL